MGWQLLDWDSDFFGFGVAQIDDRALSAASLREVLGRIGQSGVRLVYWPSEIEHAAPEMETLGGILVDRKTTFAADVRSLPTGDADAVRPWMPPTSVADLERLAVQSGEFSRFAVDPKFPREKFVALYQLWIRRSIAKEIAREVLTIQDGGRAVAMITVGEKNGRGSIGLVAVDERFRGRQFGAALARAANGWFAREGYEVAQVVTQGANESACRLYAKCGYSVERVDFFYHFWL